MPTIRNSFKAVVMDNQMGEPFIPAKLYGRLQFIEVYEVIGYHQNGRPKYHADTFCYTGEFGQLSLLLRRSGYKFRYFKNNAYALEIIKGDMDFLSDEAELPENRPRRRRRIRTTSIDTNAFLHDHEERLRTQAELYPEELNLPEDEQNVF